MGLFGSLLGNKKSSSDLPPEVEQVFEKLHRFLSDENLQNSKMPSAVQFMLKGGEDVDEIPGGTGEFGRSYANPIPVNGPIGEIVYLSRLAVGDTGAKVLYHRLGSIKSIDVYETVSIDGKIWDVLYLSFYHPRRSRKAPNGYVIKDFREHPMIYGTNNTVPQFPLGLQESISQATKNILGIPLRPPEVRIAEEKVHFDRSPEHQRIIDALAREGLDQPQS